ncbi:hypothetical protein ACIBCR_15405 [Micromonospora echinospora]|uniref:hypothetical protein n=1 Tax=Micromonospora echinospora TaxID=1877 RepID=UPI00378A7472
MTTTDTPPPLPEPDVSRAALDQAAERVDSHHQRVDQKAGVLCALNLGVITVTGAALTQPGIPTWAAVAVAAGTLAPLVGSTLTALGAFMPNLKGGWGFVKYAAADDLDGVLAAVAADQRQQAARLGGVSEAVYRKYRRMRLAVQLTAAGITCGAVLAAAVTVSRLAA